MYINPYQIDTEISTISSNGHGGLFITAHGAKGERHGKVLNIEGSTITVRWFAPWQWFFVKRALAFKKWVSHKAR